MPHCTLLALATAMRQPSVSKRIAHKKDGCKRLKVSIAEKRREWGAYSLLWDVMLPQGMLHRASC